MKDIGIIVIHLMSMVLINGDGCDSTVREEESNRWNDHMEGYPAIFMSLIMPRTKRKKNLSKHSTKNYSKVKKTSLNNSSMRLIDSLEASLSLPSYTLSQRTIQRTRKCQDDARTNPKSVARNLNSRPA